MYVHVHVHLHIRGYMYLYVDDDSCVRSIHIHVCVPVWMYMYMYIHEIFLQMANSVQYCLPPEASTPSPSPFTSSLSPTSSSRDHHLTVSPLGTGSPTQDHSEHSKRPVVGIPRSAPGTLHRDRPVVKRISSGGSYGGVDVCTLPAIQLARQVIIIVISHERHMKDT